MKKRFFLVALILFLLTLTACSFGDFFTTTEWKTGTVSTTLKTDSNNGKSNTTTTHTHNIAFRVVEDSNCTQDGYGENYCTICSQVIDDHVVIKAKGHDWDNIIGIEPTCTKAGFTAHSTCNRCGITVNGQFLDALGHDYKLKEVETPNENDTTTHTRTVYSCERCHKEYYTNLSTNYKAAYGYKELAKVTGKGILYTKLYEWYYENALAFTTNNTDFAGEELSSGGYIIATKDVTSMGLTLEEAAAVYHTFLFDCPEFYFLRSGYSAQSYGSNGNISKVEINMLVDEAFKDHTYRQLCQNSIIQMCIDLESEIDETATDEYRMKYIHDFIINRINYGYEEDGVTPLDDAEAHCIIGVSMGSDGSKTGVCEAYSKTFLYLARLYEIEAIIVHGAGHAWNMVRLNNKWYGLDATWDDQPRVGGIIYDYFLKNEIDFKDETSNGMHEEYDADFSLSLSYQFPIPDFASVSYKVTATGRIEEDY